MVTELFLCDYVVTDSFHGCVFSIIFNKPFIAVGNVSRGLARFNSLLSMFNLEKRLVDSELNIDKEILVSEIDWNQINIKRSELIKEASSFLQTYLSGDN
ncbi:polysaccharide pyruvyl transferase family protein [Alteromonas gracilis]|uniref:polysaccharide pyruvyl transferase family protein n=1 Tax=Alteromonas gracilis TaxID=1479524 RepID=UPI003219DDCD